MEETAASDQPSMELDSVDTSSELQKIEYVRDGKGGFIPKPIQPDIDISLLPETSEPATDEEIEAFVKQERDLQQAVFEKKYNEALQEGFAKKTNSKFGKIVNQLENDWIIRSSQVLEDAPIIAIGSFARKIFGQEAVEKFANDINLPEGLDFERRIEQTKIKEAKMGQAASFSKSFKDEFGYSPNASLNNIKLTRQFKNTMISVIRNKSNLSYLIYSVLFTLIILLLVPYVNKVDNFEKENKKLMLQEYSKINNLEYQSLLVNDTVLLSQKIRDYIS